MRKPLPIHPFIIAVIPLFFLVSHNISEIIVDQEFVFIFLSIFFRHIVAVIFLLTLCFFLTKQIYKSALLVSFLVFSFFTFGYLIDYYISVTHSAISIKKFYFILPGYLLLTALLFFQIFKSKFKFTGATLFLNFMTTVLILVQVVNITRFLFIRAQYKTPNLESRINAHISKTIVGDHLPDIYFIILDRYANEYTFKEFFNYDNSPFLDNLKQKGFYVASKSSANYSSTLYSLASSLNLELIHGKLGKSDDGGKPIDYIMSQQLEDKVPWQWRLNDNFVWRFLKKNGYQYIHIGSNWSPTKKNKFADININLPVTPEISELLYRSTVFNHIRIIGSLLKWWPNNYQVRFRQRERVLYKFDQLKKIASQKQLKYVFAHFLVPHEPFVFNKEGGYLAQRTSFSNESQRRKHYLYQVAAANKLVEEAVETIINSSTREPVIIIQSDEGPYPQSVYNNSMKTDYYKATQDELNEKMRILNAFYFPDSDYQALYESVTPVNTFRIIFNKYFGTHFDLEKDDIVVFKGKYSIAEYKNITSQITF